MRKRPVNLNLLTLHFPIPAIVSILHRLSGVFIFLLIPFLLWGLQESLVSSARFELLKVTLNRPWIQCGLWVFLLALSYHLLAGIRHLLMDIHLGDSLRAGRLSAGIVLALGVMAAVVGGFWVWWK